jgi:hypothetical protein
MQAEGRVGPIYAADSGEEELRLARLCELVTLDGGAHFLESVNRQQVYTASLVAAGQAPGTALGTTAPLAIWNPTNSGKVLAILEWSLAWASGTLGAGKLWHVLHAPVTATPGGTVITPINHYGAVASGQAKAFAAATGLGAANAVKIAATITALAADAGTLLPIQDRVDGLYLVPPGGAYSLQEVGAAGTTPLVFVSITWAEYPL